MVESAAQQASSPRRAQSALFDGDFFPLPDDIGFRGPVASGAAGITYRQLDYWARTGLVRPEIRGASGSGSQRLYSFRDILLLKVVKRLLDAGVALQQIRIALDHLRANGVEELSTVTLMSDGVSVYECTRDEEVIDLLRAGQGMFAISLGGVWRDVNGCLSTLPHEKVGGAAPHPDDELSRRRATRRVS
ncbi:transcriptional regulator [Acidipropionibacterium jensenii]|uniref:MerR family transcriptional regulator n=1 Tax=Acidipropionibacterium jensenii TaxID=1749 RepID=UPI000BC2F314|nr:MerR family transcriptional regulator [Acidipropionibacterium jensenii]AZZ43323.1 transcriptional regulator [Acidipropionibacterium jensenii]